MSRWVIRNRVTPAPSPGPSNERPCRLLTTQRRVRSRQHTFQPGLSPKNQLVLRAKPDILCSRRYTFQNDARIFHGQHSPTGFIDEISDDRRHPKPGTAKAMHLAVEKQPTISRIEIQRLLNCL